MENVKDSAFVNLAATVDEILNLVLRPKKRGVREEDPTRLISLKERLQEDMDTMVSSPLSQSQAPYSPTDMPAEAIEAMRILYGYLDDPNLTMEGVEERVTKLINALDPSSVVGEEGLFVEDNSTSEGGKSKSL
jgi:hypothetical protein